MKQSSSEPLEEKPFLTEDILKDEYRKVIEENLPFGFEYYEELFKWIMSKYKEAYQAGGIPERILAKDEAAKANARISSLESELKALREERDKFAIEFGNWLNVNFVWRYFHSDNSGYWTLPLPTRSDEKWTTVQLLEQFKAYTLNTEKKS